jgi:hypothetical protein
MTPAFLRQIPSPNYSERTAPISLIVVHDTEGSYEGAVAWFAQTRSQVSAHLVMREDGAEVTQMVPLSLKAWHACAANPRSIGIEGAGSVAGGFNEAWWRGMAKIVAWLLRAYGLPPRWAQDGEGAGFCSHHDLGAAGGGHNDPTTVGSSEWMVFGGYVGEYYADLEKNGLPAWALHGLPAPLTTEHPVAVTPEPSHGGAPRAEPGDAAGLPPAGSVADLQRRLNLAGAAPPLDVDGDLGASTRRAILAFQASHGLKRDAIAGPLTRAVLERVTS